MKLDKLVKNLRRDLAANPLKAGVLGVLLLGGLYFWGPLVWRWVGKTGPAVPATPAAAAASPVSAAAGEQGAQASSVAPVLVDWHQVRKWRDSDPLVRPAKFRPAWNQMFQTTAPVVAASASQEKEEHAKKAKSDVTPEQAGLVLEGVAIGSKVRRAIINHKVYRETDLVIARQTDDKTATKKERENETVFRLVRVSRRMVELERNGKKYSLEILDQDKQPAPADDGSSPAESETGAAKDDPRAVDPKTEKDPAEKAR